MAQEIDTVIGVPGARGEVERPLVYTGTELLSNVAVERPLVANGVRCHGGFDATGRYHSPRTAARTPAIEAWQARLARDGHALLRFDRSLLPPQYPNEDQAVLLLRHGVRDPIVRAVTVISIVEGFGAIIRDVKVPDLGELIVEPVGGTALAHLSQGLFEAHARDEAGHKDEGGHKQMWEAARDLAFENPRIPPDVLMRIMGRRNRGPKRERPYPQLDETLERMIAMMTNVLIVEVFAERVFEWGKAVLGHEDVSADPEGARDMVSYIQSDEKPHVEYLRTALSEIAARTLRTVDGGTIAGREVVHGLLHGTLSQMTRSRPVEQQEETRQALDDALASVPNKASIAEEFEALARAWTPPATTGFEPAEGVESRADAEARAGIAESETTRA